MRVCSAGRTLRLWQPERGGGGVAGAAGVDRRSVSRPLAPPPVAAQPASRAACGRRPASAASRRRRSANRCVRLPSVMLPRNSGGTSRRQPGQSLSPVAMNMDMSRRADRPSVDPPAAAVGRRAGSRCSGSCAPAGLRCQCPAAAEPAAACAPAARSGAPPAR